MIVHATKIGGAIIIEHGGDALLYGEVDSTEQVETDRGTSVAFHGFHRCKLPDGREIEAPTVYFPGRAERIMESRWREYLASPGPEDLREPRPAFTYRVRVWIVQDNDSPTGYGWRFETWDPDRRRRIDQLAESLAGVQLSIRDRKGKVQ